MLFHFISGKILRIIGYSLLFVSTCMYASTLDSITSRQERYIKTIEFIDRMARDIYCYWDIKKEHYGLDWEDIIAKAKSKITEQTTFEQFQEILVRIAASFHDGHVNYIFNYRNKQFYIPVEIQKIGAYYYISRVDHEKSWPAATKLSPGDKVLAVNDQDIDTYIAARGELISASTPGELQYNAAFSINSLPKFKKAPDTTLQLTVEQFINKELKTIELPWLIYPSKEPAKVKLSDIVKSTILPGNIGLLTVKAMAFDDDKNQLIVAIKQELEALNHTKALIIDVRDNGGGWGEIGDSIIAHFVTHKIRRYQAQLKNSLPALYARPNLFELFIQTDPSLYSFSEWEDYMIEPLNEEQALYQAPVYVLTNAGCFSACDTFVDSFSSNHIGEVLGSQTGGGTGYPLWIQLPWDFGNFRFSILRGYSNHNRYLEGIGTLPDVELTAKPEDLFQHTDSVLAQAYQYVLGKNNAIIELSSYAKNQYFEFKEEAIVPYFIKEAQWQAIQRD